MIAQLEKKCVHMYDYYSVLYHIVTGTTPVKRLLESANDVKKSRGVYGCKFDRENGWFSRMTIAWLPLSVITSHLPMLGVLSGGANLPMSPASPHCHVQQTH